MTVLFNSNIFDVSAAGLTVYSNPVKGRLYVNTTSVSLDVPVVLNVYDGNGIMLYSASLPEGQVTGIETGSWSAGKYLVIIRVGDLQFKKQIIKE